MTTKSAFRVFLLTALAAILAACATRYDVAEDYRARIDGDGQRGSGQTVIFFLIDGLQAKMLQTELQNGRLPQLHAYFLPQGGSIGLARTVFPSLTFPAIGSLLTGQPIERHGITGNQMLSGGETVDFEDPAGHPELNRRLDGRTIFDRLRAKGLRSVSFDYAFHTGTTSHTDPRDVKAGLAVLERDYAYVDGKTLDSLELMLAKTPYGQWPDFIFVHLVGVDFTSHDHGPDAAEVREVLAGLDAGLAPVLRRLEAAEGGGRKIISMLSADHGFDRERTKTVNLEGAIKRVAGGVNVTDEGRFLRLNLPAGWNETQREDFIVRLAQTADVDMAVMKYGARVAIRSQGANTDVYYLGGMNCGSRGFGIGVRPSAAGPQLTGGMPGQCADALDQQTNFLYHPFFVSNMAHFFRAPGAPDAIVVAKPGIGFNAKYRGQHGGPTARESLIPLLMRGARLSDGSVPAIWELLDFMEPR